MKLIADLHTHTVASTHAYSTLQEMVLAAQANGMQALAITDHAPGMPDAPHVWYFHNLLRLPAWLPGGFLLLRGAEVNCLDCEAALDLEVPLLEKLDWVIVSMHFGLLGKLGYEAATNAWLRVAEMPYVDMIGHSEQAHHLYDYDRVTKAFTAHNKVVEMNANSAITRPGNEENMRQLALACKRNGTKISVNSDAHSVYNLGNQQPVLNMLSEIGFPEDRIINSDMELLLDELALHGKDKRILKP